MEEGKLERLSQAQKHNMAAVLSSQFHARLFPLDDVLQSDNCTGRLYCYVR